MKVQDKLGKDRFKVRETSHIVVEKQIKDMELAKKLCLACPAAISTAASTAFRSYWPICGAAAERSSELSGASLIFSLSGTFL